jgi:hypothetical protein
MLTRAEVKEKQKPRVCVIDRKRINTYTMHVLPIVIDTGKFFEEKRKESCAERIYRMTGTLEIYNVGREYNSLPACILFLSASY